MSRLPRLTCLLALLLPLAACQAAVDEDELLPVEEAFAVSAQVDPAGVLRLTWTIAPGYYLYRHRLGVEAEDDGVVAGALETPPGTAYTDEFFGDVETYRGELRASAPLSWPAGLAGTTVQVRFQGCADVGVCYPPHRQAVALQLPARAEPAPLALAAQPLTGGRPPGLPAVAPPAPIPGLPGSAPGSAFEPLQEPLPGGREPPLPQEQAFVVEAIALDATRLLARFTMPPGYYLYRPATRLRVDAGDALLGQPQWPAATAHEDEHFGQVQVFFGQVEVPLAIAPERAGTATTVTLAVDLQGCQLDGICYPPMQRSLVVDLPPASPEAIAAARTAIAAEPPPPPALGEPATTVGNAMPATADDGSLLTRGGWLTLAGFLLAGLLLAFTPCVLPMVPILSGLIAGAGTVTTRRAFTLSLVYVLANAVVFTIAGVIAGLAGQNLQALFQKPWILISFAALFVALAFSMFGYYELQLPARWQNRLASASNRGAGGSLAGVALMGMLSALIVGPCVAPPLAAAVAYIGQTGDPVLGGAALFALAMGMGLPLLVVGTGAGRWLPRAGAWMDTVKALFGVAFLFLAWWMLERILPPAWTLALLGALLVGCGVFGGALTLLPADAGRARRLGQALGVIALVLGAAQLIGAMAGGNDWLRPLAGLRGGAAQVAPVQFEKVVGEAGLDAALARAAADDRLVLFDFYADWCVECKRMERYTFTDEAVRAALGDVVLLKVDVTDQTADDVALQRRFGIIGPPATLFFRDAAELRPFRLVGFEAAPAFARRIGQAGQARP